MVAAAVAAVCGLVLASSPAAAFRPVGAPSGRIAAAAALRRNSFVRGGSSMALSSTAAATASDNTSRSYLYVPSERDERYGGDVARYLLDLHNEVRNMK